MKTKSEAKTKFHVSILPEVRAQAEAIKHKRHISGKGYSRLFGTLVLEEFERRDLRLPEEMALSSASEDALKGNVNTLTEQLHETHAQISAPPKRVVRKRQKAP